MGTLTRNGLELVACKSLKKIKYEVRFICQNFLMSLVLIGVCTFYILLFPSSGEQISHTLKHFWQR